MGSAKFPAGRRDKGSRLAQALKRGAACCTFFFLFALLLYSFGLIPTSFSALCNLQQVGASIVTKQTEVLQRRVHGSGTPLEFDCGASPQRGPVVAHKIEKVSHSFFVSIADFGTPEKPNRNFQRILKGKLFQKPAISASVQTILEKLKLNGFDNGAPVVVDVGANVGMAAFAAAAMGFKVLAFEPIVENIQKLCDGVYLNRVSSLVQLYHLAVSNSPGYITMHKVVGRLDNSAVSATGAKLAFKANKVVPITIKSVTLDSMLPPSTHVVLLKIDVQGWEYNVLKGASKLLSRPFHEAPYIVYEEDDNLLRESNSTSKEILRFLAKHGYHHCVKEGGDRHCSKETP